MAAEGVSDPGPYLQRKLLLLTDPDAFFEEQLKYPYIWQPSLLVLLAGFAFLFQGIATWTRMPLEVSTELTFGLVMLCFIHFSAPVMLWLLLAASWRVLSPLAGGNARFYTLLRVAGYGFPPFVVTGAAWSLGRYLGLSDVSYDFMTEQLWRVQDEMFELRAASEFATRALADPVFQLLFLVGLLFTTFSVFLWVYGVANATGLSKRRSLLLVVLPYAVFVWWAVEPVFL